MRNLIYRFTFLTKFNSTKTTMLQGLTGKRTTINNITHTIQTTLPYISFVTQSTQRSITDPEPFITTLISSWVRTGLIAGVPFVEGARVLRKLPKEKGKISRRLFLAKLFGGTAAVIIPASVFGIVAAGTSKGRIKHEMAWSLGAKEIELVKGKGMITLRNAITAEKAESFIAPRLQQQLGRKPVIAMVWGAGHYGIKGLLENPKKRRKLLQKYNYEKYLKRPSTAIQIKLDSKGRIRERKEFFDSLAPALGEAAEKGFGRKISRREFLARALRRKRHA